MCLTNNQTLSYFLFLYLFLNITRKVFRVMQWQILAVFISYFPFSLGTQVDDSIFQPSLQLCVATELSFRQCKVSGSDVCHVQAQSIKPPMHYSTCVCPSTHLMLMSTLTLEAKKAEL